MITIDIVEFENPKRHSTEQVVMYFNDEVETYTDSIDEAEDFVRGFKLGAEFFGGSGQFYSVRYWLIKKIPKDIPDRFSLLREQYSVEEI